MAKDDGRRNGDRRNGSAGNGIARVTRSAARQLGEVTGRRPEFVSRVERRDDVWRLTVEVVEVERIPDSTSVLGSYEVVADGDGNILEYARSRRYLRNQPDQVME
jgi:hypothetical protein